MNLKSTLIPLVFGIAWHLSHSGAQEETNETKLRFASKREFPYVALVRAYDKPKTQFIECGGVILTNDAVLTSCSCLAYFANSSNPYDQYFSVVVAGSVDIKSFRAKTVQVKHIKGFEFHPKCTLLDYGLVSYDLAIVKLEEPFTLNDHVAKANTHNPNSQEFGEFMNEIIEKQTECKVLGWGINPVGEIVQKKQKVLKVADVNIIKSIDCLTIVQAIANIDVYKQFKDFNPAENGISCALNKKDSRDIYYGQGGPVICEGYYVGFVTYQMDTKGMMPLLFASVDKAGILLENYFPKPAARSSNLEPLSKRKKSVASRLCPSIGLIWLTLKLIKSHVI